MRASYEVQMLHAVCLLPITTVLPAASAAGSRSRTQRLVLLRRYNLLSYIGDPFALQKLRSARSPLRISFETSAEELNALLAQLLSAWQLRRIALSNVVHDGPFVVETGPWTTTCTHFQDDAAKGPDID